MDSKDTPLPADWAIIAAYRRAFPDSRASEKDILDSYKSGGGIEAVWALAAARLIEQHEQPPVDPDVEAVKRIITVYWRVAEGLFVPSSWWDDQSKGLEAAVTQYKQEVQNRG